MTARSPVIIATMLSLSAATAFALPQDTRPSAPPDTQPATQPRRGADSPGDDFARSIELAHGIGVWRKQQAVAADIIVRWGGSEMLRASMVYDHHSGRVRMELADGTVMVFDGQKAWSAPERQFMPGPRFHLLTWPYFLAAPFKLRDPGTDLEVTGKKPLLREELPTARLAFEPGTGDTPDDWYVLYADPKTNLLKGMAYIVTYGTPTEEAEKEPHVIVYEEYRDTDGVLLSPRWTFYHWSDDSGAHGEPIGGIELTNIRFVQPDPGTFAKPQGASEDPLPK